MTRQESLAEVERAVVEQLGRGAQTASQLQKLLSSFDESLVALAIWRLLNKGQINMTMERKLKAVTATPA